MKLGLDLRATLSQTLTPQQIQYLKLLQLPLVQLEQQVRQEIELNPMLEDGSEADMLYGNEDIPVVQNEDPISFEDSYHEDYRESYAEPASYDEYNIQKSMIDDQSEPFEFHKLLWDGGDDYGSKINKSPDEDDDEHSFQIKDNSSLIDDLEQQLRLLPLTREELFIGEHILGNIDTDGYLRRELTEIIDDTNEIIDDVNLIAQRRLYGITENGAKNVFTNGASSNTKYENGILNNPALAYSLSGESAWLLNKVKSDHPEINVNIDPDLTKHLANIGTDAETYTPLSQITYEMAERVLKFIQKLDPPGIGSRSVQECLLQQSKAFPRPNEVQNLAVEILENHYDAFAKKHYHVITKQLGINDEYLKEALDFIKRLNPRPGGGDFQAEINTVIPDFVVEQEEDTSELIISVNDTRVPALQLSKAYESMKKEAKYKLYDKETRDWIRQKFEDAKFLIQALRQRKNTMMKVMTAIAQLQKDFFYDGPAALKPLIYKDISEETGLDISTVCRIVNGKYVQTGFGTFELKFFFSESLPTDEGEEVSTRVIKQILKEIIESEDKRKPLSDDDLSKHLKDKGYNVARRTVAKYREQLKLPVARLRKELI